MHTDADLIDQWRSGKDAAALEALLRRYETRIYSYLLRMLGNQHEAEDAAQEAFIRAVRQLPRYHEQGHFRAWLFRIAHREGLRIIQRRPRTQPIDTDAPAPERSPDRPPDDQLVLRDDIAHLEHAIARLPEVEREVVLLRTKQDLTFREIAEIQDCPLNTALARMHRALARLREWLKEPDGED